MHPAQDYDTQLQRALNYEDYDMANDIRQRRQSIDEAMDKLRVRLPDPWPYLRYTYIQQLNQVLASIQSLNCPALFNKRTTVDLQVFKSGDEDSDGLSVEDYPSQEVAVRVQLQRAIEEER